MTEEPSTGQPRQSAFLSIFLALFVAASFFVFMVLITGGFFLYLLLLALASAAFVALHYLLWGRLLSHQVQNDPDRLEEQDPYDDWR